jgi:phage head maturation protease
LAAETLPDQEIEPGPLPLTGEDTITTEVPAGEIEVRDLEKRELGALIVPWDTVVDTPIGLESFQRGAFSHVDPRKVVLKLGHEEGPPVGRGFVLEERAEGAWMGFRVSKTQRGDEALTLAVDGVTPHVSIEYRLGGSQGRTVSRNGRRVTEISKADLRAVATTYKPYYESASVTYVRALEDDTRGDTPMPDAPVNDAPEAPAQPIPTLDLGPLTSAMTAQTETMQRSFESFTETFADRFSKLEERDRKDIIIPGKPDTSGSIPRRGDWMQVVLTMLAGQRPNDLQMRELAEIITSDNIGVVPPAYLTEIIGIVDRTRPFLGSTRRLDLPPAGMSLVVPKIDVRPTTDVQAEEKDELDSTATEITTETFDAVTVGGSGDISLQLLRRSSPSFLSLYLELLAEAYARNSELLALTALLAEDVNEPGALDPEDLDLGAAWVAAANMGIPPDTIWLSTEAVGAFIDAKADGTNMPLYSTIQAGFNAANGAAGTISGLRPVHVPALDAASATIDAIVGPSRGFGWTEDGTYTLQVDVPAKAGRDVALVGLLWFAPMYPGAFSAYTIAS